MKRMGFTGKFCTCCAPGCVLIAHNSEVMHITIPQLLMHFIVVTPWPLGVLRFTQHFRIDHINRLTIGKCVKLLDRHRVHTLVTAALGVAQVWRA